MVDNCGQSFSPSDGLIAAVVPGVTKNESVRGYCRKVVGKGAMSVLREVIRELLFGVRPGASVIRDNQGDNPLIDYLGNNPGGRMIHKVRHYFDIYHRHFSRFRGRPLTMIEIGVFNGGSLPMWRNYLGLQATIVGVDINPGCKRFSEPGIDIVIGDQGDRGFLRSLADRYPNVAILLDDGGHRMHQQIATFEELYPHLQSDGIYMCEDTGTSYIPTFGGGLGQPQTFIETVKPLIDRLHAFHSTDPSQLVPDAFTCMTDSLHFYDSVLVIEKKARAQPETVAYGSVSPFRYIGPSLSGE